jgi:hypothetical protein
MDKLKSQISISFLISRILLLRVITRNSFSLFAPLLDDDKTQESGETAVLQNSRMKP